MRGTRDLLEAPVIPVRAVRRLTSSYRGRSIPPFGGGVLIGQRQDSKPSTSRRSNAVPPKWRLTCPYCGMSRRVSPVPDAWSAAVTVAKGDEFKTVSEKLD